MHFCCVCVQNLDDVLRLIEKDNFGVDYFCKLRTCVPQEIWKESYFICNSCKRHLNTAYEFIQICLKNNAFRHQNLLTDDKVTNSEIKQPKTIKHVFYCFDCPKRFKQKASLAIHIKKYHNKVRKKVNIQNVKVLNEFKVENGIFFDVEEVKNKIKYENNDISCSELIADDENLERIVENDADNDIAYSTESQSENDEKHDIKLPKKERKPVKCELCKEIFKTKNLWVAHIKENHKDVKPFACDQCNAQYLNHYSLLIHQRKHTNEKPFICSTCGKTFISSADLNHHYKIHDDNRSYTCQICNKSYKTHSNLRTHRIQVHLDYKDWEYECKICQKKFPIKGNLIKHMKRHNGVKNFSCHICPKKFVNKAELTVHLNTHTDQRNFKCQICFKTYKNREGLRRHMKVVHDLGNWKYIKPEKKFQCPICPKTFAFTNKLQRHIYSHTGERPFVCDFCPKRFVDTYGRKVHMVKEHPLEFLEKPG